MKRLGYDAFVAQGGDWGAVITEPMAVQAPPELLGIHTNMPGAVPPDIAKALQPGAPPPSGLSPTKSARTSRLGSSASTSATRSRWRRARRR